MKRIVFESSLPGIPPEDVQNARIAQWHRAGFNAVMLQVDQGTGSCWPSTLMPPDPRVTLANDPLRRLVDTLHTAGFSVILDFATGLHATWASPPIRPELAEGGAVQMYNYWLPEFREWKSDVIAECAGYVDADAVALDYLRSGRAARPGEESPGSLIAGFLALVRSKLDKSYPLVSVNNAVYAQTPREGVNIAGWLAAGLVDYACLFNYTNPYPVQYSAGLDSSRLWLMSGNYDTVNGQVVKRGGITVAKDWRQIRRQVAPAGIALYLSNQLTDDQAAHLAWTDKAL